MATTAASPSCWRRTVSTPDSQAMSTRITGIRKPFAKPWVVLTFARARERGIAAVTIEGVERHPLDDSAPTIQWQDHDGSPLSDGGPHLLVIRCTGRSRPEATGKYIEIDAIDVKP